MSEKLRFAVSRICNIQNVSGLRAAEFRARPDELKKAHAACPLKNNSMVVETGDRGTEARVRRTIIDEGYIEFLCEDPCPKCGGIAENEGIEVDQLGMYQAKQVTVDLDLTKETT